MKGKSVPSSVSKIPRSQSIRIKDMLNISPYFNSHCPFKLLEFPRPVRELSFLLFLRNDVEAFRQPSLKKCIMSLQEL